MFPMTVADFLLDAQISCSNFLPIWFSAFKIKCTMTRVLPSPAICLRLFSFWIVFAFCVTLPADAVAQEMPGQLFSGLHWRLVGPFRAGRVISVSGVPGSDREFFFGGVDGGVWKTTDAGTVWEPIFDHEP